MTNKTTEFRTITISGGKTPSSSEILTPDALGFLGELHERFNGRRLELLGKRQERQARFDAGEQPDFLPETEQIRKSEWTVTPIPDDLKDRRTEITGPVERKMVINALNSGAKAFMACFEDATSPTWGNMVEGQKNLFDAVRRTISYTRESDGKEYKLNEKPAVLIVRPRGWHLDECHVMVDGEPMSGGLFDFGLFFYHNAQEQIRRGTGPYFYLPKVESHLEARLWNDVFEYAQERLGIPNGTIRATVLIETILAAFEMDEILYELRDHAAGLNCGRWDYIFSYVKRFRNQPEVLVPDRSQVTMTAPFMRAYTQLCVKTCHRRGAMAIGGMAAQIPVKGDEEANADAFRKVAEDKRREATDGHDGTWVAHPGLVPVAMNEFDRVLGARPNQLDNKREDVHVTAADLLQVPDGTITEEGIRTNINVGIRYIAAWLCGSGAVPINNLMEDAATAEISRSQIWQWIRHPQARLDDGRDITDGLFRQLLQEELWKIRKEMGAERFAEGKIQQAADLFTELTENDEFEEFLTLPGYGRLNESQPTQEEI
ncbi:malate synthase A [Edaphobacillus lindanitolerans]|uniref:Malate synthase n=1 Tax=Edaphobacillus lindanitolerans TaxID=550447 RepID=A0A1U7PMK9_9BACI|nr:malate synthase A [Edaphobacillus lindanitolerans]SIT91035.1 malate synthase [Edaphobacillus lindanitolerans]